MLYIVCVSVTNAWVSVTNNICAYDRMKTYAPRLM